MSSPSAAHEAPFTPTQHPAAPPEFDPSDLDPPWWTFLKRWGVEFFAAYPQWPMRVLRPFFRVPYIPLVGWTVLGYDDVREVFEEHLNFPVPWGDKMLRLTDDRNFVLGMVHGDAYRERYRELAKAFPLSDIPEKISAPAARETERILREEADPGDFDAVEELVTRIPTLLCDSYFGIRIADPYTFARATLAVSVDTFGNFESPDPTPLAAAAERYLRGVIEASIPDEAADARGVVREMLRAGLGRQEIYAHMLGMVMGFIPTNVLAGGNILETLLRRPEFLERAREAARDNDDEGLWRCLRETLRFRNINPAMYRRCSAKFSLGRRFGKPLEIPAGRLLVVSAQSAMFDSRRVEHPHVFNPGRPDDDYLVFGYDHWCIGAYIAKAQLTRMFAPLVRLRRLRPVAGVRAKRFEYLFPISLRIAFDR